MHQASFESSCSRRRDLNVRFNAFWWRETAQSSLEAMNETPLKVRLGVDVDLNDPRDTTPRTSQHFFFCVSLYCSNRPCSSWYCSLYCVVVLAAPCWENELTGFCRQISTQPRRTDSAGQSAWRRPQNWAPTAGFDVSCSRSGMDPFRNLKQKIYWRAKSPVVSWRIESTSAEHWAFVWMPNEGKSPTIENSRKPGAPSWISVDFGFLMDYLTLWGFLRWLFLVGGRPFESPWQAAGRKRTEEGDEEEEAEEEEEEEEDEEALKRKKRKRKIRTRNCLSENYWITTASERNATETQLPKTPLHSSWRQLPCCAPNMPNEQELKTHTLTLLLIHSCTYSFPPLLFCPSINQRINKLANQASRNKPKKQAISKPTKQGSNQATNQAGQTNKQANDQPVDGRMSIYRWIINLPAATASYLGFNGKTVSSAKCYTFEWSSQINFAPCKLTALQSWKRIWS